jgi:hypothetical protein
VNAASVRLRRLYRPVAAPSARSGIARERAHTCFGRFGRSVPETQPSLNPACPIKYQYKTGGTSLTSVSVPLAVLSS